MDKKRIIVLGSLFVVLAILVVVFFSISGKEKIKPSPLPSSTELEQTSTTPEKSKKIALFFLSERDSFLHSEERRIAADLPLVHQAKRTIEELIRGSQEGYVSPFPPETKLRELYLTREGVAYVDFSKDILEKHISGSSAEIATVYSAVNSLTYNFKSIRKVFILIEGRERETLRGHINLSQPFLPKYDLITN